MLAPRWVFFFEKWYLDGQLPDGSFFFCYLAPMVLLGMRSVELIVCLFSPEGVEHKQTFHLQGRDLELSEGRDGARFAGGELVLDREECRFSLEREEAAVDLRYRPTAPPWLPAGGGLLLRRGKQSIRWVVPVPRAHVRGRVRVGGHEVAVGDGALGYSDFVQTNISPWRIPLRELLWGRALSEQTLVIWNRAGFKRGRETEHVSLGLVRSGAQQAQEFADVVPRFGEWSDHSPTGDRYPSAFGLTFGEQAGPVEAAVDQTRLLLGDFVADVQEFNSGFERWLYRTFTGNPVEYKLLSRVRVGDEQEGAVAAHEWVRWGRGRDQPEQRALPPPREGNQP
jgi:hypothetical protein